MNFSFAACRAVANYILPRGGELDRAAFVEELEQVALVRLIPLHDRSRRRADVQTVDVGRLDELAFPGLVICDRADYDCQDGATACRALVLRQQDIVAAHLSVPYIHAQ